MIRAVFFAQCLLLVGSMLAQDTVPKGAQESGKASQIRDELAEYASGVRNFEELYEDSQSAHRREIVRYFQANTNLVSIEQKLIVAACMGKEDDFENAAKLLEAYVLVYTNNGRAWNMLGTASSMSNNQKRAVEAYQKAFVLGYEPSLLPLTADAFEINRLDIVRENVPKLLELKRSGRPPNSSNLKSPAF